MEAGPEPERAPDSQPKPDQPVELTLNLPHAESPGTIQLAIQQFGQPKPDQLGTKTFSEPARIEALALHEGDHTLTLTGTSLEEVKQVTVSGLAYMPDPGGTDKSVTLSIAKDAKPLVVKSGDHFVAKVELTDGRTLDAPSTVLIPRPSVTLISKRIVQPPPPTGSPAPPPSPIALSDSDDLPLGAQIVFFVKSEQKFPRSQQIEVASVDDSLHTTLSIAAGSLILQDSHTVLARLDPLKTFGTSAFGPLHLRAVASDGTPGEWLPLATLVRLPTLTGLRCPSDVARPCQLDGTDLYLIDSIATDTDFTAPTTIPEGFVDTTLLIPRPLGASFYLKLRDDPATVHGTSLPITPETLATPGAAKPGVRPSSASTAPPHHPSE
ncbi:hypothetical protein [Granulicella sp. WH15]|uniref:hypothetical protein n=1 Tax=Granulicella sp. WH15 TaxID=2602070 RepID=UPI002101FE49|nr:hypothetical protein [Granulicella sp. WH15]